MSKCQRVLVWKICPRTRVSEGSGADYPRRDLISLSFQPQFVSQHLETSIWNLALDLPQSEIDFFDKENSIREISQAAFFLVELSLDEATPHDYDHLCGHLTALITSTSLTQTLDLVFVVSRGRDLLASLQFKQLIEICAAGNIGIVVIGTPPFLVAELAFDAGRCAQPNQQKLTDLFSRSAQEPLPLTEPEVLSAIDVLFGHFEMARKGDNTNCHLPVLVSVERFLRDKILEERLRVQLRNEVGEDDFLLAFYENQGGLIEEFALRLVDHDDERIAKRSDAGVGGKPVLVICDVLSRAYPLQEVVNSLSSNGATPIIVFGFVKLDSFQIIGATMKYLVCLPYQDYENKATCPFCEQENSYESVSYFQRAAEKVRKFDAYTFWELVSDVREGCKGVHWVSPRTKYHYLQLVYTPPVVMQHKFGIARRLWNLLWDAGIRSQWVDRIVVTEEKASVALGQGIGQGHGSE